MSNSIALPRNKWLTRTLTSLTLFCAMSMHPAAYAFDFSTTKDKLNKRGLDIKVGGNGWGDANPEDIERVLYSVASELEPYFPHGKMPLIKVEHGNDSPVALYEREAGGQYVILLTAKDRHWSQFAYQFAHELTHVLSNFDNSESRLSKVQDPNQWFEESLCEAASLFALKRMAATWEVAPPYPQWKNYAASLRRYAEQMRQENHRTLPAGFSLANWFVQNESAVRADPYMRSKNEVVAARLLTLLEQHPEQWGALAFLNHDRQGAAKDIGEYLRRWYACCPDAHKTFVQAVMVELGLPSDVATMRIASAQ